ncbi:hypothetical protein HOP50_02g17580 [Chloropicon primus]|nr:hypothetical protein A3770_02p17610 [Chloropicon primus]UPQ98452.1 hypothetical protein HOP50_02g17580 [Chloropicon primus]|eukprot:QDZ19243.1 hypothetical protein A3770_02p17610 [Chloropicon primus]
MVAGARSRGAFASAAGGSRVEARVPPPRALSSRRRARRGDPGVARPEGGGAEAGNNLGSRGLGLTLRGPAGRVRGSVARLSGEASDAETDKPGTSSSTAEIRGEGVSLEGLSPAEAVKASRAAKEEVRFSVTKGITEEDLQAMQKYAESEGVERIFRGALIEARLIEWPGPSEALFTTLIVIVMVGGSAGVLFLLNSVLAKSAELFFK